MPVTRQPSGLRHTGAAKAHYADPDYGVDLLSGLACTPLSPLCYTPLLKLVLVTPFWPYLDCKYNLVAARRIWPSTPYLTQWWGVRRTSDPRGSGASTVTS